MCMLKSIFWKLSIENGFTEDRTNTEQYMIVKCYLFVIYAKKYIKSCIYVESVLKFIYTV